MIRRKLMFKVTESLLVLFKYGALAMILVFLFIIFFQPSIFSAMAVDLNANLFSEMDIEVPTFSEQLTSNSGFGDWLSSTKFSASRLRLRIEGDRQLRIIGSVMTIFSLAIFFRITSQLLSLIRSVKEGSPFIRDNVRRIRSIGFLLIGIELFYVIAKLVIKWLMSGLILFENRLNSSTITVGSELFNNWFFIGLIILVIAEVFRQGIAMKEEQELTI